ncbi:DUF4435 domain-containing protein [Aeromonas veronii]|uniref:DUF4435 domain-containing protein n=1 Tax=Aeromonas veronii TaxID=654 RepID=UPI00214E1693|nr:DUF4435 domain-containing protein [Aeromonas veronii]MCR3960589.1 DUF4435 domain-containing protein [Aeromonas veronii]
MQQTPSEIVTEITMSKESTPWLAVEGDSDERLLRTRRYPQPLKIVVGYGWEGVIKIIEEYSKADTTAAAKVKLVGIIDRDYRDHLSCQTSHERIVLTDFRDIENMLFNSSALKRVISEYASNTKIPRDGSGIPKIEEIKSLIYNSSIMLGKFRIYCQINDKYVDFKKLDYVKFVCDRSLSIDAQKFINHLAGKNPGKNLSISDWNSAQKLSWNDEKLNAPQFIANGHDVMALLCLSLRKMWGSLGGEMTIDKVEPIFRVGYSDDELEQSVMWCNLQKLLSD